METGEYGGLWGPWGSWPLGKSCLKFFRSPQSVFFVFWVFLPAWNCAVVLFPAAGRQLFSVKMLQKNKNQCT